MNQEGCEHASNEWDTGSPKGCQGAPRKSGWYRQSSMKKSSAWWPAGAMRAAGSPHASECHQTLHPPQPSPEHTCLGDGAAENPNGSTAPTPGGRRQVVAGAAATPHQQEAAAVDAGAPSAEEGPKLLRTRREEQGATPGEEAGQQPALTAWAAGSAADQAPRQGRTASGTPRSRRANRPRPLHCKARQPLKTERTTRMSLPLVRQPPRTVRTTRMSHRLTP